MSKYIKFEDFMQSVMNEADSKCRARFEKSLAEVFQVEEPTFAANLKVIDSGWGGFAALVALLELEPLGFVAALAPFVAGPIGVIVVGALAAVGGDAALRTIYKNKVLPIAVKETGDMYKSDFEGHIKQSSYIDSLIDRASDTLISKSTGR